MLNRLKTFVFLAALTALFLSLGQAFGGQTGVVIALLFAVFMNFGVYWFSDRIVLRMYNAREIGPPDAPQLFRLIQDLTISAGLPMPRLYVIPESTPNTFATGRDPQHASIAVTIGLVSVLNRNEIRSVMAHELGHCATATRSS